MKTSMWGRRVLRSRVLLAAGLLAAVAAVVPLFGQDEPRGALPEGLRHVPPDAMAFLYVRVGDFLQSDAGKMLKEQVLKDKRAAEAIKQAEKVVGVTCADLESVTLIVLEPPADIFRWGPGMSGRGPGADFGPTTPFEEKFFEKKPALPDFPKEFDKVKDSKGIPKDADPDFESPVVFQDDPFIRGEMGHHGYSAFGPLLVLTTKQPYDRKKMLKTLVLPSRDDADERFHGAPGMSVLFLSDRSFMLGPPPALVRYADLQGRDSRTAAAAA